MLYRSLTPYIEYLATKFSVFASLGPRQSGKTTLVKTTFTHFPYVNLEDFKNRTLALNDPKRFMLKYPEGAIFDEIQRVPLLLSYIQVRVDELEKKGSDLIPIEIKSSKTFSTSFLDGLDLLSNKVLQISL